MALENNSDYAPGDLEGISNEMTHVQGSLEGMKNKRRPALSRRSLRRATLRILREEVGFQKVCWVNHC